MTQEELHGVDLVVRRMGQLVQGGFAQGIVGVNEFLTHTIPHHWTNSGWVEPGGVSLRVLKPAPRL